MRLAPILVLNLLILMLASPDAVLGQKASAPARKATPLSAQEKQAQQHYRVALEALKSSDLSTALDELKAAADLAPQNPLIWYNLAIVESKRDETDAGLEHLHRAMGLTLPSAQQDGAQQLEATLLYAKKKHAMSEKVGRLGDLIAGSSFECNPSPSSDITGMHHDGCHMGFDYFNTSGYMFEIRGTWELNLADFDPTSLKSSTSRVGCPPEDAVYTVSVSITGGQNLMTGNSQRSRRDVRTNEIITETGRPDFRVLELQVKERSKAEQLAQELKDTIIACGGKE